MKKSIFALALMISLLAGAAVPFRRGVAGFTFHRRTIDDAHIKNFPKGEKNGSSIPLPRGKIDLVPVFQAFADIGYTGVCSLEYERDFQDNLLAVVECIAYERGVCDAIRTKAKMKPAPDGANALTGDEKADGWQLLRDGRTFDGWLAVNEQLKEL